MDKINQSVSYEQILDDTNQLIQISDCNDFSMLYANQPARMFTHHQNQAYQGKKCYQYMMGLEEQCPFCPMRDIGKQDSYITEIDNGVQVFTVKTKRITWEGKDAFIEYATDITTVKRAQQIFESQMKTLIDSIPEAQGIFHLNLTQNHMISINGISQNVEHLKDAPDVNLLIHNIASFIPDKRKRSDFRETFRCEALINAYQKGRTEIIMETQSYYDDGDIRWARVTARLIMNPNTGDLECLLYGMDINDEKKYLEKSKKDMLTGVYSKKAFEKLAEEYVKTCNEQLFAIIFIDLDNFKVINDTLGHLVGDKAIIDTAEKLQTIFSNKDIISRFGGDEFCILVKDIPQNTLIRKLDFMLKKLQATYGNEEVSADITSSIGVAFCSGTVTDIIPLIQVADKALYEAKHNGRNQYYIRYISEQIVSNGSVTEGESVANN